MAEQISNDFNASSSPLAASRHPHWPLNARNNEHTPSANRTPTKLNVQKPISSSQRVITELMVF